MVLDAIRKNKLDHVVIIISRNPRYLDEAIQKPEAFDKEVLSQMTGKRFLTKGVGVKWIRENRAGRFPAITAPVAKAIWELYFQEGGLPKGITFEIKVGFLFSPILNADIYLKSQIKKSPEDLYFLYKSEKNEANLRFEMILSKYGGQAQVKSMVIPVKYALHATEFRRAILEGRPIRRFLPKPRFEAQVKELLRKI
jgi:hypothetical protein